MKKLINGFKLTKLDNIIAGILFVLVIALPAYFCMENWQVCVMYAIAIMTVIGCWRLSYVRGKNDKKTS